MSHQVPILLNDRRFKLLACGRRFGKTAVGLLACLRGHGPNRGFFRGAIDGGTIWWVAPSYPTIVASNIWDDLKRATRNAWTDKNEIERRIQLPGGGSITIRSADNPDSLRGPGLDGLFIDEAAFLSRSAWTKSLRPALTDKQGWAMLASTPNGQNWLYDLFKDAGTDPLWDRWQLPSWTNPLVTREEMDSVRREIGLIAFAQEHAAQFMEVEGALWSASVFAEHIWADDQWPREFDSSVIAVDPSLGKTEQSDPSAIVFAGFRNGTIWVDCSIERRTPVKLIEDTFFMFDRYRPNAVGIESNGFQEMLQPLFDVKSQQDARPPLPLYMIPNTVNKQTRIRRLDPYLDTGRKAIKFKSRDSEDCKEMVEQLQMFPNKGYHDDGPDALEMAIRLATELAA